MRRRLLNVMAGFVGICAGIGSPIAILLLLLAPHIGRWGSTLEKHSWLVVVLVLIFLSRFVVGGVLYYESQKYQRFLYSPEGKRHRAQQVQESIAAIIADAKAKPRLRADQSLFEGFAPGAVMTEARRLAKNIAKNELKRRGIRLPWEVDANEITKIANALVESDINIIRTAKANLEKYAASSRHFRRRRGSNGSEDHNES